MPAASDPSRPIGRLPPGGTDVLHLFTLWAFAVAQPLFDVLRRNREFFVAHRADAADVVLLAATVSVAAPALIAGTVIASGLAWRPARPVVLRGWVALLAGVLALQALSGAGELPTGTLLAGAAAAGGAAAWLHASAPAFRLFLTILSPAVLLFPAILLLHPDMAAFVRPDPSSRPAAASFESEPPPIVMVIFDQLPLTSLMTESGEIDGEHFPGFAALASSSTWYRNASTVGDYTGFAVPPIVTGLRPSARRLPVVQDYPQNLFTWLGERYRFEVFEAITGLCPEALCPADEARRGVRLLSMTADSAVVFLHIALPPAERAKLPPLTENWRNFAQRQKWTQRWIAERDADRRVSVQSFLDGISGSDPQPSLYFLHALLPHEPYMYLPSGQRFTPRPQLIGLARGEVWRGEDWLVAEQYRQHLIQLGYVDAIVGRLVARLRNEGLWDRALVVVTADHGASFRPGLPFKAARIATIADIAPVPLFIKAPGQTAGTVSDRNVESPDVLPTIADLLGVRLTWEGRGQSARDLAERDVKALHYAGGRRVLRVSPAELIAGRTDAVRRKFRVFGDRPTPYWQPALAPHTSLIGRPVADLPVSDEGVLQVLVNDPSKFRAVALDGPVLPAQISGRVVDQVGQARAADLAIAVNGTIVSTTRAHETPDPPTAQTWTSFFDPAALRSGANDVEVFVVRTHGRRVSLDRAYTSSDRPDAVNLASRAASVYWGITQSGLQERAGTPPVRWTEGEGVLIVPLDVGAPPRSLRIGLGAGPREGPVRISINDCVLYDGPVDSSPWYRTFALAQCPEGTMNGRTARIVLRSSAHLEEHASEVRKVGVLVETVNLYALDWPLPPQRGPGLLSVQLLADPDRPRVRGSVAPAGIANRGSSVLFSPQDAAGSGVELDLQWARAGGTPSSVGQRLRLPRTLYPSERTFVELPLMPPADLEDAGPWDLHVVTIREDGRAVPLDAPCVVRVVPDE